MEKQIEPVKDLKVPESTIKGLGKKIKDMESTIAKLKEEAQIKNMFIVNLNKQCIALKLELGRKLTLSEIEFLKKSCI